MWCKPVPAGSQIPDSGALAESAVDDVLDAVGWPKGSVLRTLPPPRRGRRSTT